MDVVGQYLCKNETGSSVACGLAALGAQFTVEADGTTKTYSDAFVVKSKSSEVTLAKEGDGGAAISTGRDKLVGILVGVAGDAFYCASAESVFARYFPDFESLEIAA